MTAMESTSNSCFICNKDLTSHSPSSTATQKSFKKSSKKTRENETTPILSRNLEVIFLLRKLLEVPHEQVVNLLGQNCNHPSEWDFAKCCGKCAASVEKARETYQNILVLCKELRKIKGEIVETVRKSWDGEKFGVARRRQNFNSNDTRTTVQDNLVAELKEFISTHEYCESGPQSDSLPNGDKLADNCRFNPFSRISGMESSRPSGNSDQCMSSNVVLLETAVNPNFIYWWEEDEDTFNVDDVGQDEYQAQENNFAGKLMVDKRTQTVDKRKRNKRLLKNSKVSTTGTTSRKSRKGDHKMDEANNSQNENPEYAKSSQSNEDSRTCPDCNHIFKSISRLKLHRKYYAKKGVSCRKERKQRSRTCQDCGRTYRDWLSLKRHLELFSRRSLSCRNQKRNPGDRICSSCGGIFTRHRTLLNHLDSTGNPCQHVPQQEVECRPPGVHKLRDTSERRRRHVASSKKYPLQSISNHEN